MLSEAATAIAATPTTTAVPTVTPPTSAVLISGAGATGAAAAGPAVAVCANTCAETRLRIAAVARIFFIINPFFLHLSEQKLGGFKYQAQHWVN